VVSPQGEVVLENQPHVVRRVVSEKTAKQLASMLSQVTTEGGTGAMANIEGFEVAGKTGTAQKADPVHGGYSNKRVGSFVGFVPANNPRVVALVLIDEPEGSVYGGVVAAPVFRNIAQGALRRMMVAPQKTEALPVAANIAQGELPLRRIVKLSSESAAAGNDTQVPDFIGLSMREALEKAQLSKIKVKLQGNGYVVKQLPAAGDRWNEDGMLMLNLQG
jgi:cell division protein FtsI (penicillin-binding protein 3)